MYRRLDIFRRFGTVIMDNLESVDITERGSFKYILIRVTGGEGGDPVTIVRGYADCTWHADIFDRVSEQLKPLRSKCLGGGKIDHNPDRKMIEVYGISQGFGKADHELAATILKKRYPDYRISVNNDD